MLGENRLNRHVSPILVGIGETLGQDCAAGSAMAPCSATGARGTAGA